jgi:hypothetical protein
MFEKFKKNQISFNQMKMIEGGSIRSKCIASNAGACRAAGHAVGSGGYDTCVITLRTECENTFR